MNRRRRILFLCAAAGIIAAVFTDVSPYAGTRGRQTGPTEMYERYQELIRDYTDRYGEKEEIILDDPSETHYLRGLCYAKMVDFDLDNSEELVLIYLQDDRGFRDGTAIAVSDNADDWTRFWNDVISARGYRLEVWTYRDGDVCLVYEGTPATYVGADSDYTFFCAHAANERWFLVTGKEILFGENTLALYAYDGSQFSIEGLSPSVEYLNCDCILSQTHGEVKCTGMLESTLGLLERRTGKTISR